MKALIFFILLCIYSCPALRAQDTARTIDRVYTYDKIYVGQITEDKKGESLTIALFNKGSYTIDYKQITKIQYAIDNPNYKAPPEPTASSAMRKTHEDISDTFDLVAFNGYRATPRVTDKLIKKRNTGIGLTVAGACLITLGSVLYAVTPKQSINNSNGYPLAMASPSSIAGILMIVCGAGIAIPGAAIWGISTHRIHKAEREE